MILKSSMFRQMFKHWIYIDRDEDTLYIDISDIVRIGVKYNNNIYYFKFDTKGDSYNKYKGSISFTEDNEIWFKDRINSTPYFNLRATKNTISIYDFKFEFNDVKKSDFVDMVKISEFNGRTLHGNFLNFDKYVSFDMNDLDNTMLEVSEKRTAPISFEDILLFVKDKHYHKLVINHNIKNDTVIINTPKFDIVSEVS